MRASGRIRRRAEGSLYETTNSRELLKLARFRSTPARASVSLAEYWHAMKQGRMRSIHQRRSVEAASKSRRSKAFLPAACRCCCRPSVDEIWISAGRRLESRP